MFLAEEHLLFCEQCCPIDDEWFEEDDA